MPEVGSIVVFQAYKQNVRPGPRAKEIRPQTHGEMVTYSVDKFWIVAEISAEQVLCLTRGGKAHRVESAEVRKATLIERFGQRDRVKALRQMLAAWQAGKVRPAVEEHPEQV
jgi:hypothetical protein